MNESQQVEFLLKLGERLDNWTSPGDENDIILQPCEEAPHGVRLWNPKAIEYIPYPARVIDVLAAQWIRIKDFTTQKPRGLLFNPAQRHFMSRRTGRGVILKAGRAGFTTALSERGLLRAMTRQGYTSLLVSHKKESAQSYFVDVHYAFNHLGGKVGEALRAGALRTTGPGAKKNVREIYFPVMNSRFFVETAGEFAPAEGESIQYLLADEMARWLKGDPKQVITTLLSHVTGDFTEAYLLSRPFGQTGEFHERYWAARRGESDYRAYFYQWWWNPAQRSEPGPSFKRTAEEQCVAERYAKWRKEEAPKDCDLPDELDDYQLAWRRAAERELGDKFPQEFAEDEAKCFLGSGNCPFKAESIAAILGDMTPVLETTGGAGETENGLRVWEHPVPGCWYVLFIDPAGSLFTSRIAMQLINGRTCNQAAEWVGRSDMKSAAAEAVSLAQRYGKTIVVYESNLGEVSSTLSAELTGTHKLTSETWPRLWQHQDSGGQWQYGWKTSPANRPDMLECLAKLLREAPHLFHSRRLATELKACVRKGDRIQAGPGMTDDLVMAAAGAHKVIVLEGEPVTEPMMECIDLTEKVTSGSDSERGWTRLQ